MEKADKLTALCERASNGIDYFRWERDPATRCICIIMENWATSEQWYYDDLEDAIIAMEG